MSKKIRKIVQHIIRNYNDPYTVVYSRCFRAIGEDETLRRIKINGVWIHYIKIMFYQSHVTFVGPACIVARIFYSDLEFIIVNGTRCIYD